MFDTGQKLIEAFMDIDALVAENERLREAIAGHMGALADIRHKAMTPSERLSAVNGAHIRLWAVLEEGDR